MDLPPRSIAGQDMCVVSGAPLSNHFLNEFTLVGSCFVQVASPPLVLGFGRSCLYLMALPPRTDRRAGVTAISTGQAVRRQLFGSARVSGYCFVPV